MTEDMTSLTAYKIIYTKGSVRIIGVYEIASYDENLVIIKCENNNICISGDNIIITLFCSDEIHISGKISTISFA